MKNSDITINDLSIAFKKTKDLIVADPEYYYNVVLDWSDSNGKLKNDWIATIRNWARRDKNDNKLRIIKIKPTNIRTEDQEWATR